MKSIEIVMRIAKELLLQYLLSIVMKYFFPTIYMMQIDVLGDLISRVTQNTVSCYPND